MWRRESGSAEDRDRLMASAEWSLMAVAKNKENGTKRVYRRKRKMCASVCVFEYFSPDERDGQVLENGQT